MKLSTEYQSPAFTSLNARPIRVAVLVPEVPQVSWELVFRGALASQTRVWGGISNVVLPFPDDFEALNVAWALLKLWDPDLIEIYVPSHRGLEHLGADTYTSWRSKLETSLAGLPAELQKHELEQALRRPLCDVDLPNGLNRLLVQRQAMLHHQGAMQLRGPLTDDRPPPYPLVDVLNLSPFPEEVVEPPAGASGIQDLLLAAEFGSFSTSFRADLEDHGLAVRTVEPTSSLELAEWLFAARPPSGFKPFSLAEIGLVWLRPEVLEADKITVVAGEDPWDFAYAYAVRRAGTFAFWMPRTAFDSGLDQEYAIHNLADLGRASGFPIVITSVTDREAAEELARGLPPASGSGIQLKTLHWRDALPRHANRLLVEDTISFPTAMYLEGGQTPYLATPVPGKIEPESPLVLRWMTEVAIDGWAAMRHSSVGKFLLRGDAARAGRPTASGIAYLCPNWAVHSGAPLEWQTYRPRLQALPLMAQVHHVLEEQQWRSEPSEKGNYTLASASLFGGFEALCDALCSAGVEQVLTAYLDANPNQPGKVLGDGRRYLTLDDLRGSGHDRAVETLVEDLEGKEILRRGFLLKCGRCRNTAWYRPAEVDPRFSCARCSAEQRPDRFASLDETEPRWYYRLDEALFQFVRHRGELPVLVVNERFRSARDVVQVLPELLLTGVDGNQCEIDAVVTDGADLWVVEAFTGAKYAASRKSEIARLGALAQVADLLNAQGAILATAESDVAEGTRARATEQFRGPRPELELITGARTLQRPARVLG